MAFPTISYRREILSTTGASKLAELLHGELEQPWVVPNDLLCVVEDCVNMLEKPANTGIVFFVRHHASTWSLVSVISVFESAVLLSRWILRFAAETCSNQG